MTDDILLDAEERMGKSVEAFEKELVRIRTGRATPNLLDGIKVEYYGGEVPINQVASINIPEPRSIAIQPWDKGMMSVIEKAVLKSNLGITPVNDGAFIRLNIPTLTEERRKNLVKVVKKLTEDYRVEIRNIRRDANEQLKKAEKASDISEDESKRAMNDVQELTDNYIKNIDKMLGEKETEIMEGP